MCRCWAIILLLFLKILTILCKRFIIHSSFLRVTTITTILRAWMWIIGSPLIFRYYPSLCSEDLLLSCTNIINDMFRKMNSLNILKACYVLYITCNHLYLLRILLWKMRIIHDIENFLSWDIFFDTPHFYRHF